MSLYERALAVLPGGVNSPVRAFAGVGGEPLFVRSAEGAYLETEDGRRLIDYIGSYGPLILGHRPPEVVTALERALKRGTTFGVPTAAEVELAELICSAFPAMDMVRLVNSGTGFRVAWGGVQTLCDVEPDLTTLGKVIGGGLPIGAYGGGRDLMRRIAPAGPVYQAGTLSGNPLAMAAGSAALGLLAAGRETLYDRLEASSERLESGMLAAASRHGIALRVQRQGSMVGVFFTDRPVERLEDVGASDRERYARVFHRLLEDGVHLPPSAYETLFVSTAHGEAEIDRTARAFDRALEPEARG